MLSCDSYLEESLLSRETGGIFDKGNANAKRPELLLNFWNAQKQYKDWAVLTQADKKQKQQSQNI